MKTLQIILFIILTKACLGQKNLVGLFGKCDNKYSGYMCQQVLFNDDKTFIFYDLLHLSGWTLSHGIWTISGDTVTLKSAKPHYFVDYNGYSLADSINITVKDSLDPLAFANITLNSTVITLNLTGTFKYPRQLLDTLYINYLTAASGPIIFDKEKIANADTVVVKITEDFYGKIFFNNEKWLLQNNKLYHTKDSDGTFDKEKYFIKAKLSELKYHKDY